MAAQWIAQLQASHNLHSTKIVITQNSSLVSYETVISSWRENSLFRDFFIDLMISSPYAAFRWETPPVTKTTIQQPFECVLVNSPSLAQAPDRYTFSPHFTTDQSVVQFLNLGNDAILVAPCPTNQDCDYSHLGAFVRNAPRSQQHNLWTLVGHTMTQRISNQPVWLSTAGGGVAWGSTSSIHQRKNILDGSVSISSQS